MEHSPLLIGIGGAGCAIADQVHAALGGRLAHINAVEDITPARPPLLTIALPTRHRGARDAADVSKCAEGGRAGLAGLMAGASQVFLFTGLGGAVGSGATPVVAHVAVECGCDVAAFATLPFALENRAGPVAEKAIAALRAVCPATTIHDHELASRAPANASLSMEALLALSVVAAVAHTRDHIEALA